MTPIGPRQAGKVARLSALLSRQLGETAIVWVQNPVEISQVSEPQPDLAVLRWRPDYYEGGHPVPDDMLLVIEVSDTSIHRDRMIKQRLYAAAGIQESWIIDLTTGVIEDATGPSPAGYANVRVVRAGDPLAPTAFPTVTVPTDDLLR